jgi:hypothetical protein
MTMNESDSCYSWTLPLIMLLFQIDGNKPYFDGFLTVHHGIE